jgi:hypothetical protein
MKKLLIAGLTLFSLQGFSQSYVVLNNGVTLTTDNTGYLYDFDQFIMPYKITGNGGQFLLEEDKLLTIDEKGFLYRKDEKIKRMKGKGINYLVTDDNELVTIAADGIFYKYKDSNIKKIKTYGGKFFTVATDEKKNIIDLYTLNARGNFFKMSVAGLNPAALSVAGGSYFMASGMIYTISRDGLVFPKPEKKVNGINRLGGNFFIDSNNVLFTVSEEGFLIIPILPKDMNLRTIQKVGANYMIDTEGRMFIVDKAGTVVARSLKEHDLRSTKIISM